MIAILLDYCTGLRTLAELSFAPIQWQSSTRWSSASISNSFSNSLLSKESSPYYNVKLESVHQIVAKKYIIIFKKISNTTIQFLLSFFSVTFTISPTTQFTSLISESVKFFEFSDRWYNRLRIFLWLNSSWWVANRFFHWFPFGCRGRREKWWFFNRKPMIRWWYFTLKGPNQLYQTATPHWLRLKKYTQKMWGHK